MLMNQQRLDVRALYASANLTPYNQESFLLKTFDFKPHLIDAFLSLDHQSKLKMYLLVQERQLTGRLSDPQAYSRILQQIAFIAQGRMQTMPQQTALQQSSSNIEHKIQEICDFNLKKLGVDQYQFGHITEKSQPSSRNNLDLSQSDSTRSGPKTYNQITHSWQAPSQTSPNGGLYQNGFNHGLLNHSDLASNNKPASFQAFEDQQFGEYSENGKSQEPPSSIESTDEDDWVEVPPVQNAYNLQKSTANQSQNSQQPYRSDSKSFIITAADDMLLKPPESRISIWEIDLEPEKPVRDVFGQSDFNNQSYNAGNSLNATASYDQHGMNPYSDQNKSNLYGNGGSPNEWSNQMNSATLPNPIMEMYSQANNQTKIQTKTNNGNQYQSEWTQGTYLPSEFGGYQNTFQNSLYETSSLQATNSHGGDVSTANNHFNQDQFNDYVDNPAVPSQLGLNFESTHRQLLLAQQSHQNHLPVQSQQSELTPQGFASNSKAAKIQSQQWLEVETPSNQINNLPNEIYSSQTQQNEPNHQFNLQQTPKLDEKLFQTSKQQEDGEQEFVEVTQYAPTDLMGQKPSVEGQSQLNPQPISNYDISRDNPSLSTFQSQHKYENNNSEFPHSEGHGINMGSNPFGDIFNQPSQKSSFANALGDIDLMFSYPQAPEGDSDKLSVSNSLREAKYSEFDNERVRLTMSTNYVAKADSVIGDLFMSSRILNEGHFSKLLVQPDPRDLQKIMGKFNKNFFECDEEFHLLLLKYFRELQLEGSKEFKHLERQLFLLRAVVTETLKYTKAVDIDKEELITASLKRSKELYFDLQQGTDETKKMVESILTGPGKHRGLAHRLAVLIEETGVSLDLIQKIFSNFNERTASDCIDNLFVVYLLSKRVNLTTLTVSYEHVLEFFQKEHILYKQTINSPAFGQHRELIQNCEKWLNFFAGFLALSQIAERLLPLYKLINLRSSLNLIKISKATKEVLASHVTSNKIELNALSVAKQSLRKIAMSHCSVYSLHNETLSHLKNLCEFCLGDFNDANQHTTCSNLKIHIKAQLQKGFEDSNDANEEWTS